MRLKHRNNNKKKYGEVGMRGAALIQFASRYASIAVQLVITMVLARLVSPEDFGLLAIVTVFTAFFSIFSDMGIGVAIVQFRELEEEDFGALFAFSVVLALALAVLFCLASLPISWLYGDDRLVPVCLLASLSLLFGTLNMVPNGLMLRERRFAAMGVRTVVSAIVSGAVAIAMACMGFGYWALVVQMVASAVSIFFWNVAARPIHGVTVHFLGPLRMVFSYSAYQFGATLVNYFSRNLDNLLIGKVMGAAALGYYDKAYKLTTYPMSAFSSVIASVVQPYMAEHQDDPDRIFGCWLRLLKGISLVAAVVSAVFFSASAELVELFYGSQWGEAAPAFAVLSVSVYFQMIGNPSGAFFQSLGRTDLMFRAMVTNTTLTVTGLILGLAGGTLVTVALGVTIAFCCHLVAMIHFLVRRGFGRPLAELRVFIPEIVLAVVASLLCVALGGIMPEHLLPSLACKVVLVVAVMGVGYLLTGQLSHLRTLLGR